MANTKTRVVILGGGFGGIKTALQLAGHNDFDITLLSDQDNFRYYPTLYRAATGGRLAASSIPLDEILGDKKIDIIKDSAKLIDRKNKKILTKSGKKHGYDILVIALGVVTNYFGIKGLAEYSYGIKTLDDAEELRDHIHKLLLDERKPDLNYIVIGGGPTGVELAGAMPAYIRHIMERHDIKHKKLHIALVEAAPRLTPRMPKPYSAALQKRLKRLGVRLYLNQTVQAETADTLMVNDQPLKSHTVVWTAGVTNNPFFAANKFTMNERGKVKVGEYLLAEPDIYVIGDNADTPYSGMAQTALYDAAFLADNLVRQAAGKPMKLYKPKKPIYVTPVGGRWAAVLWGGMHIYGWLGWLMRSAADFAGYHDYEPWWQASGHWAAEYESESTCPVCAAK